MKQIELGSRRIGAGAPTYVIAELSANHGQSLARALELVDAAAATGADAIKIQTFTPDTITLSSEQPWFRVQGGTLWDGRTLHSLYAEAMTPWEWHAELKQRTESHGLDFFSTPFDATAVDFLTQLGVPLFKIASFELVDLPLIRRVAATGKPLIMSTGMATLSEIDEAVSAARAAGARELVLLKCNSGYPAPLAEMNLRTIPHLAQAFSAHVGLSDHTPGFVAPVVAVALGACVIEKHFTLRRADGGPDAEFSLEPAEFKQMVDAVRAAEQLLGTVSYAPTARELASTKFRRSLYAVADIKRGEPFTTDNVRSIRPAGGLHTRHLELVLGSLASADIARGTPLAFHHVAVR